MPQQVPITTVSENGGATTEPTTTATCGNNSAQTDAPPTTGDAPITAIDTIPVSSSASSTANTTSTAVPSASKPPTKLNGLRNRIIQRPPPLVLDKVSNFYDNETNCNPNQATQTNSNLPASAINTIHSSKQDKQESQSKSSPNMSQSTKNPYEETQIIERSSASNGVSANQKFWASLNENASRNKALANARAAVVSNALNNHQDATKESTETTDTLGADLVIRKRNSSGNITSSRIIPTISTKRQDQRHKQQEILNSSGDDATNHSDQGGSAGGGNLIGVDNSTPPASSVVLQPNVGEAPLSASSSRSRSNNPFLDNDDEDDGFVSDSRIVSRKQQVNNFQKRPASFIAATNTDRTSRIAVTESNSTNTVQQQQQTNQESLNQQNFAKLNLEQNEQRNYRSSASSSTLNNHHEFNNKIRSSIYVEQNIEAEINQVDESNTQMFKPIQNPTVHDMTDTSVYGAKPRFTNKEMPDQSISFDSENTIMQPPPSATMQLPYWTEATYDLPNAILDTNSIAGGAEIGQFIYISQSGDIILELDRVKVSGFTLTEFKELVDSKQLHLMTAVQTKHSNGLTHDLKRFLNQSFPKNSGDKNLQDLIRENIYKRTIPCTTRPPRSGEQDKIDYHFLSMDQFVELNNRDMLLECGSYSGHYYGTLKPLCDLNTLSTYQSFKPVQSVENVRQMWDANHPAVGLAVQKSNNHLQTNSIDQSPLYENHESMQLFHQAHISESSLNNPMMPPQDFQQQQQRHQRPVMVHQNSSTTNQPNIVAVDSEALPQGWERVIDQTHGTYYIDHNTRRTQYERPYEVELTKGSMGFGFTLVEADNGMLLVRSIIQGGPAYLNGSINPGDILISAVGISVANLQHTDVARLFSTFAVGDRVRLTFAKSNFVLDDNIIPDEYLFSNGTNGDLAIAVNPNNYQSRQAILSTQNAQGIVDQDYEFVNVNLRKGDQGFGFIICNSKIGQKVAKIHNSEISANLKQGDILMCINDDDITELSHKEVAERLKRCPEGGDVRLTVKRKKRFRSKTPMAMHTDAVANGAHSFDNTPQRKCKTPSLDGLMLRREQDKNPNEFSNVARPLFHHELPTGQQHATHMSPSNQHSVPALQQMDVGIPTTFSMTGLPSPSMAMSMAQSGNQIYGDSLLRPEYYLATNNLTYETNNLQPNPTIQPIYGMIPTITQTDLPNDQLSFRDNASLSAQASEIYPPATFRNDTTDAGQMNQYNDLMHNDKLAMSHLHQPQQQNPYMLQNQIAPQAADYYPLPVYSNNDFIQTPTLPAKPMMNYSLNQSSFMMQNPYQNDYYANAGEIAMQQAMMQPVLYGRGTLQPVSEPTLENDDELHQIDLERENTEKNWGIRLIGGAEVERAISIGSIVDGGAASKNGQLKAGDEIISINGINIEGAAHEQVVELISTCATKVSLVIKRKKFPESCDVVLTKHMDEGFGFVIISSGNCALIGRIIQGSPADRCKQLHVRDRIIAVDGRYIAPNMRHPQIVSMIKECGSTLRLRIIPVDCYTIELIKNAQNDNFGFSIRGGSDYDGGPPYLSRVNPDGPAHGLLNIDDQILEINNLPTIGMTHQQAVNIIRYSDPIVRLKLRRKITSLVDSPRALQKYNQVTAEMITVNQNTIAPNDQITSSHQLVTTTNALATNTLVPTTSNVPASNVVTATSHDFNSLQLMGETNNIQTQMVQQQSASLTPDTDQQQKQLQQSVSTDQPAASSSSSLLYENQNLPLYAT